MKKHLTASAVILLLLCIVLSFSGCQNSDQTTKETKSETPVQTVRTNSIVMQDFSFIPEKMEIKAGDEVTWINKDSTPHAVILDGIFDSGAIESGKSIKYKFEKTGEYKFKCTIHPTMVGVITVK
jgi:plastocyanin